MASASGVCVNDSLQSMMRSHVIRNVDAKCNKSLEEREILSNGDDLNCTLKKSQIWAESYFYWGTIDI